MIKLIVIFLSFFSRLLQLLYRTSLTKLFFSLLGEKLLFLNNFFMISLRLFLIMKSSLNFTAIYHKLNLLMWNFYFLFSQMVFRGLCVIYLKIFKTKVDNNEIKEFVLRHLAKILHSSEIKVVGLDVWWTLYLL